MLPTFGNPRGHGARHPHYGHGNRQILREFRSELRKSGKASHSPALRLHLLIDDKEVPILRSVFETEAGTFQSWGVGRATVRRIEMVLATLRG